MSNQPPDPYGQPPESGQQPPHDPYAGAGDQSGYQQQPGGYPPPPPVGGYQPPAGGGTNTLAIVSLVCSLAGLLIWISAPVGAILGHVSRKQIRERGEEGDGLALTGVIVGWIITGLGILACCGIIGLAIAAESA